MARCHRLSSEDHRRWDRAVIASPGNHAISFVSIAM
jgi:hypothetical protein